MARALLVAGDEPRHFDCLDPMRQFLERGRQPLTGLKVWKAAEMEPLDFIFKFATELIAYRDEPLLLVYSGHGLKEGWVPSPRWLITYHALASMLAYRRASTVFVNSCCYPAAIFSELEAHKVSPDLVSVIAAGPADKVTYAGLVARVAESWGRGEAYRPFVGIYPDLRMGDEEKMTRHQKTVIAMRAFFHRFFGMVEPWQDLDERRWGAILDHHFFSKS